jgi:predicted nucleotidyltransferase
MNRLNKIFEKYEVMTAYLFGSQRESGLKFFKGQKIKIEKTSDLDFGLLLKASPRDMYKFYGNLYYDLSAIFEPFSIDIVFLHEVDSLFKYEIIKGCRIYEKDEKFADEYEEAVMKYASDLSFKRKMFEQDFFEALKNGYFEIELK